MIKVITDQVLKQEITEKILRDLPEWFGIESSIVEYIEHVKVCYFAAYQIGDEYVGFVALDENPISYDMHVLGVLKTCHHQGIGSLLVDFVEGHAKSVGKKYMTVKTLSADHPDKHYAKTRLFYEHLGYEHLEVFKTLWGEANPCLYMIKALW